MVELLVVMAITVVDGTTLRKGRDKQKDKGSRLQNPNLRFGDVTLNEL